MRVLVRTQDHYDTQKLYSINFPVLWKSRLVLGGKPHRDLSCFMPTWHERGERLGQCLSGDLKMSEKPRRRAKWGLQIFRFTEHTFYKVAKTLCKFRPVLHSSALLVPQQSSVPCCCGPPCENSFQMLWLLVRQLCWLRVHQSDHEGKKKPVRKRTI